jgi:hypothetical protein
MKPLDALLNLLIATVNGIKGFFRRLLGLIIPFFRKSRDFQGYSRGFRWFLHILVLVGVLVLLWWINRRFDLGQLLKVPIRIAGIDLRDFWLPILFLLVYALGWLGWWLYKLLGPEEVSSEFPDIDDAWEEATKALSQAGIGVADAPLFLLLGRTEAGVAALAEAADLRLVVKPTPSTLRAPLHVFGNHEGIYVLCPGASLLGRQAAILAGEALDLPGMSESSEGGGADGTIDPGATIRPTAGPVVGIQDIFHKARQQGRKPDQLTAEEQEQIRGLIAEDEAQQTMRPRKVPPALLKNPSEVARFTARLQHLCRLIARDRQPWCPLNGMLFLVPFAATDTDDLAHQTSEITQRDYSTARDALKVNCPAFAMVCDLESLAGFRDFIERVGEDFRQRRVGTRFPLVPDLEENRSVADMIEAGVDYVCTSLLPNWVYKMFRLEAPGAEDLAATTKGNVRLYQLLNQMRERQKRLRRILSRWTMTPQSGPYLFGGCYLAGTGKNGAKEQAFVKGVFDRLIKEQNYVSWTQEALDEDANLQTWTTRGYIFLGVLAVVGLVLLVLLLKQ